MYAGQVYRLYVYLQYIQNLYLDAWEWDTTPESDLPPRCNYNVEKNTSDEITIIITL